MARKPKLALDWREDQIRISTTLPATVADRIEAISRAKLSTKSVYIRDAVIERLAREGVITVEDGEAAG